MIDVNDIVQGTFQKNRHRLFAVAVSTADQLSDLGLCSSNTALEAMADVYILAAFDIYAKAAAERNERISPDRIAERMLHAFVTSLNNEEKLQ
ncbi:hypothetical protein X566_15470 [Afipia sp. P52-10]|uniref:hypothetical protein n=1 Tax=Afipia sp. P52-10 TaxID=1429916 RepID=UPI0003DF4732|nr:hypothetical protein [Afipia sp. P52-10]ETR79169.1 hypothetical protein X566_15470 [Afipia sp. P52-10]